jgi:hypothetical protein
VSPDESMHVRGPARGDEGCPLSVRPTRQRGAGRLPPSLCRPYRTNPTDRLIAGSRASRLSNPARDVCKPIGRALRGGGAKAPSSWSEHPGLTHVLIRFGCRTLLSPTDIANDTDVKDSRQPRLPPQCALERRIVPTYPHRAAGASVSGPSNWR